MKFTASCFNPPYQKGDGGNGASAVPLYHHFIEATQKVSDNVVAVVPARWMTGGKGLDEFRERMVHDERIVAIEDYADSKEVFANVDIKGGVCILDWAKQHTGPCRYKRVSGGGVTTTQRFLCAPEEDTVIRESALVEIKNKVISYPGFESFSRIVSPLRPYGLRGDTMRNAGKYGLPEFSDTPVNGSIPILGLIDGRNRGYKYVPRDYPFPRKGNLEKYKIFAPRAYGCGSIGEESGTPVLGTPVLACTETFLEIGPFDTKEDTENALKYYKSKFFRTLIGCKKQTQDATKKVYEFAPLQDFTSASDIDWSQSIPDIDRQLYRKYGLDEKEIAFIESYVKEMV